MQLGLKEEAMNDLSHALQVNPHFSLLWEGTARSTLAGLRGSA